MFIIAEKQCNALCQFRNAVINEQLLKIGQINSINIHIVGMHITFTGSFLFFLS